MNYLHNHGLRAARYCAIAISYRNPCTVYRCAPSISTLHSCMRAVQHYTCGIGLRALRRAHLRALRRAYLLQHLFRCVCYRYYACVVLYCGIIHNIMVGHLYQSLVLYIMLYHLEGVSSARLTYNAITLACSFLLNESNLLPTGT
jgi:hypothetical protein